MTKIKQQHWSSAQLEHMHMMRSLKPPIDWKTIAESLGRTMANCSSRYHQWLRSEELNGQRRAKRAERREKIEFGLRDIRTVNLGGGQSGPKLTPELFDRQARRLAAYDARDITGAAFGDPPRGYSALDERGGRAL